MKYGIRTILKPEVRTEAGIRSVVRMVTAAFEKKFTEDNIPIPDDLVVDITVSDKQN